MLTATRIGAVAALALGFAATPASAAELIVNGGFETNSGTTTTPAGWTNVGHQEGVIAYSAFVTPAYQGNFFYDLGGYGGSNGPTGDGIQQTIATVIGQLYTLTFGLSWENAAGTASLNVLFNNVLAQTYTATANNLGAFKLPFTTQTLTFTATSTSTLVSFIEGANPSGGNMDPLIDGVSVQGAVGGAVPEPATWAMMIAGFGVVGGIMRRRRASVAFA